MKEPSTMDFLTDDTSWESSAWPVLSPHNNNNPSREEYDFDDHPILPPPEPSEPLTIYSLPPEILLEAFEYLTYPDLKFSVRLVCTKFNTLLTSHTTGGSIQRILFRDTPLSTTTNDLIYTPAIVAEGFSIHPIFSRITYGFTSRLLDVLLKSNGKCVQYSSISRENAISPSVERLTLCFMDTYAIDVSPPAPSSSSPATEEGGGVTRQGVSVWDVMRHAVMMIKTMEEESEDMYTAYHDLPPGRKSKKARKRLRQQMETAVQMRLPSERYEWSGIERVEVKEGGKVCLHIKVKWKH